MEIKKIFKAIIDNIKNLGVFMLETYTLRDRVTILNYYSKSPLHLFNYLRGKKNNKNLNRGISIKNKYGLFYCGSNLFSVVGCSTLGEPEVRKNLSLKRGSAVDIGANIGMHTIPLGKMLKNTGKVIAIEPEPNNFKILKRNVELNKLNNVILINVACSSKEGKFKFYLDEIGTGAGSFYQEKVQGSKTITVQAKKLDKILLELRIKKIDLIKIDVEGGEADVLEGAKKTLKKSHPKIIFEAWNEEYLDKIKKVLQPFNYKIKQIAPENYYAY